MRVVVSAMLLWLALCVPSAWAQDDTISAQQRPVIAGHADKAEKLANEIQRGASNDARLVEIRLELEDMARALLQSGVAFRPRLADINARLDQLGPMPGEGQPAEPEALARERAVLIGEKADINTLLGEAENLSLRVNRMIDEVVALRRALFTSTLSKRYEINYALIGEVARDFGGEMRELYGRVASWLRFATGFKLAPLLGATFLALLLALVLLFGGRRLFGRLLVADHTDPDPSYLSRLSVAFWSTLLPTAALAAFLGATHFLYSAYNVLRADIAPILLAAFQVTTLVFFIHRLAWRALSPDLPNWRLIDIESRAARVLVWLITLTAAINGLDFFLSRVSEVMASPLAFTVGKSLLATVLVGILVVMIGALRPFPPVGEDPRSRAWPLPFRYVLFVLGGITIAAALLGYIGLARFLSQQIVVTGAILTTMYIGYLSAGAISEEGGFAQTALGRRIARLWSLEEGTLDQLGLALSIGINALVVVLGVPLILFQWGFQWGDIQAWVYRVATEIRIGSVSISMIGILTGVLVFVVGFFVTRLFQGWLDGKVMARGRVDTGVRNSIRTAVGYAGVAVAALIGISAAGIDLSNLALVAGALSLGIGFGLQNVVSNFVSGLILLAERPFKVGDWIVAGPVSGTVKKISVRATEIETFQRQTVILPNSELINAAVGNWTHKNKLGRIDINVQLAYDTDARRGFEIMGEIARSHPNVLRNPEPFVLFSNFGPAALEFQVRVFVADVLAGTQVQNDIRFALMERFAQEGIEMPSTPRAAHPPPASQAEPELHVEELPAQAKRRRRRKPDPDS
jgi:potassium-dependent mechanosensitive channel